MHQAVALNGEHFEVAVVSAAKIALDDGSWTAGVVCNELATPPRIIHVVVFVKVVDQIGTFKNYDLEISMITSAKVALNDCCGSGAIRGNDLPMFPGDA